MKTNERYLEALRYMNATMKADNKAGHQWKYCNVTKKKAKSFDKARAQGKYLINCCDGVQWALKMVGINTISWYGGNGTIVWLNSHAKSDAKKNFDIISTGGKTVTWLEKNAKLCDGDILVGYQGFCHTNAYYGNGKSFDSGHAYATPKSGEGAKIKKLIGSLSHKNDKVNYILRIKDRAFYRVQAGAYSTKAEYDKQIAILKQKKIPYTTVSEDAMIKIQLGYFSGKTNAERCAESAIKKGVKAFVKEM